MDWFYVWIFLFVAASLNLIRENANRRQAIQDEIDALKAELAELKKKA